MTNVSDSVSVLVQNDASWNKLSDLLTRLQVMVTEKQKEDVKSLPEEV